MSGIEFVLVVIGAATLTSWLFKAVDIVEGRLQIRDWTDKAGNKRTTEEVVADNVYFADSKRSESNDNQKENFNALSGRMSDDFVPISEEDGDIPF